MKINELKLNKSNPRVCKDHKFEKLKKSISEFPKMLELRPMIIDDQNIVLGGNMRLTALKDLGYKEIPDNWVKRASELTEEEKQRFVIADNVGFGDWDWDILANEWDSELIADWGLDVPSFEVEQEIENNDKMYSQNLNSPIYKITGEKPNINDLYDNKKCLSLISEINNLDIDKKIKEFLIFASYRHIVFDYEKIAEYYAHSDSIVQDLIENNALIIIDYNKSIEQGYSKLIDVVSELSNE